LISPNIEYLRRQRILFSNNLPLWAQRQPLFSDDFIYLTSSPDRFPRVKNLPPGAHFDCSTLSFKDGWSPDIFIAKIGGKFALVPTNVEALKCPKVLILGLTHHGDRVLSKMVEYALREKYDFYVTEHFRHHLWFYWIAGLKNLFWLPGLMHAPAHDELLSSPFSSPDLKHDDFKGRVTFVGKLGDMHPRRRRLLRRVKKKFPDTQILEVLPEDSLRAYNAASISINVSLNGDLNRRVFEVLSACFLSVVLSMTVMPIQTRCSKRSTVIFMILHLAVLCGQLDMNVTCRTTIQRLWKIYSQRWCVTMAYQNVTL
jgi:hypothetical protein